MIRHKPTDQTNGAKSNIEEMFAQLHQDFVETARDQLDEIDIKLDNIEAGLGDAEEHVMAIQRLVHNIKGQGGTFGFPLTGRVAHMLEDYIRNAGGIGIETMGDIRTYLQLMTDLVVSDETIANDNQQGLLKGLPTGQAKEFSGQKTHNVDILLVMPSGLQRKMIARELVSCGFRVMRAYSAIEALSVACDITPEIMFVNYDMTPFNGLELCKVFADIEALRGTHIVLLTSRERTDPLFTGLPKTVSVVEKRPDFLDRVSELLIQWGVFGQVAQ